MPTISLLIRIEDNEENYTRFYAVERGTPGTPTGLARASISFVIEHEPGSLHRALGLFAAGGLDLTRLESRPIPGRPCPTMPSRLRNRLLGILPGTVSVGRGMESRFQPRFQHLLDHHLSHPISNGRYSQRTEFPVTLGN